MKNAILLLNVLLVFIFIAILGIFNTKDKDKKLVKVKLNGAAKNTGTYYLREETKLSDLIELVGGYKDNAKESENIFITNDSAITIDTKYRLKK